MQANQKYAKLNPLIPGNWRKEGPVDGMITEKKNMEKIV